MLSATSAQSFEKAERVGKAELTTTSRHIRLWPKADSRHPVQCDGAWLETYSPPAR
jgi:hypothetical protein